MNATAEHYNEYAKFYDYADKFGTISLSHDAALQQIMKYNIGLNRQQFRVLDLGVGDGGFLKKLKPLMPNAEFYGLDVSKEMLKKARENIEFHGIQASAGDADKMLPLHMQDLVLAHFINAYIPMASLLQQVKWMTKANGYFSFITSTYESFPNSQMQLAKFVAGDTIMGGLVGHYYKTVVSKTPVASGYEEIVSQLKLNHFEILDHQRIHVPIYFENIDEMSKFGIDGTWFLNTLSATRIPKQFFIERLKRFFNKIFEFPYHDEQIIDIMLVRK
jgi:SAM-dependent methyltransferase